MNRQEKEQIIESVRQDFLASQATFLIGVEGLTVNQLQGLRKNIRERGGRVRLVKNTLTKIAASQVPSMDELKPYLKTQVALVFARNESPAVAKALWDVAQDNDKVLLIVGHFESRVIDKEMIKFLALLPPLPVLAAQVCGVIQAPLVQHVNLLYTVMSRLVSVLDQAAKKRTDAAPSAEQT